MTPSSVSLRTALSYCSAVSDGGENRMTKLTGASIVQGSPTLVVMAHEALGSASGSINGGSRLPTNSWRAVHGLALNTGSRTEVRSGSWVRHHACVRSFRP